MRYYLFWKVASVLIGTGIGFVLMARRDLKQWRKKRNTLRKEPKR